MLQLTHAQLEGIKSALWAGIVECQIDDDIAEQINDLIEKAISDAAT
jgi:hypothetical protein